MTRIARIAMDNAVYHIITRGNQKQTVFRERRDYTEYLSRLEFYKKKYAFKLYSFCLMPNHVHLIIEVDVNSKLNKIMRGLNLSYTLYFNFKYKTVGHLWQDRFKSKIIEKDTYLLECINYIEANPLRANLTSNIEEYVWSSYAFKKKENTLLDNIFSL
jgi:putative transposase